MTISAVACVSDIEDLANRASVSCSSSGRMSCQRNSASFYSFSSEATCIEPPNSQLEFENKQEAGCGRRAIIHLPSRPFSLQTPVETRFSASWSDLQLDSQHPEEIGWWLSVQKNHQVTCAEMSNCQTLCATSNSAQCDTLSIVARKYQPSKVQLLCAKKLPSFKAKEPSEMGCQPLSM